MDHYPAGSRPPSKGPDAYFSGDVTMTPILAAPDPARANALSVHFSAGARTAWHTHPLGQTLYVTQGQGLAQVRGGPVIRLSVGDTVWFPPNEEHWHGATSEHDLTHIAVQESLNGSAADWFEHVSQDDYSAAQD